MRNDQAWKWSLDWTFIFIDAPIVTGEWLSIKQLITWLIYGNNITKKEKKHGSFDSMQ